MDDSEDLCRRCGKCCREKIQLNGLLFATPVMCKYYDSETGLCTVYERRHEVNPQCLDRQSAIERGVFPADCPYVRDIADYAAPIEGVIDADLLERIDNLDFTEAELWRLLSERMKKQGISPRKLRGRSRRKSAQTVEKTSPGECT